VAYVIVDADVLIDASRGIQESLDCLRRLEQQATLAISAVTEMELIVGCRNKTELQAIEKFLRRFQVFGITESVSAHATQLLKQHRLSHGLLILDALIAATALEANEPLISKTSAIIGLLPA